MSDFIKREDAIEVAYQLRHKPNDDEWNWWLRSFNAIPTIDAVSVVRCKECKWGKPYSDKQLECDALGLGGLKFPDGFCSYGEREGE